ncbi:MAG TPA: ABC transporter permease [Gemmatimonadaceae bacterium]|jgi:predicted permease|nr:ABC transporter permease [Gemmatimonadaceae bacterium]
MLTDLRLAVRGLRRSPVLSAAAVITLALASGATTAIFSVVRAVLLEALPYRDPTALMFVRGEMRRGTPQPYPLSYLDVKSLAEDSSAFAGVVPVTNARSFNLGGLDEVEHVNGEMTDDRYFQLLGVSMTAGRAFEATEAASPGLNVVILGHDLWTRRFGANPGVIGTTILLNEMPFTVIGVAARGFNGVTDESQLWLPIGLAHRLYGPHYTEMRQFRWLSGVARLRDGMTAERVRDLVGRVSSGLERQFPTENQGFVYTTQSLEDAYFGSQRRPLWSLLAAAGFVLLIACANIANLLLARAAVRRRETAVRVALGATRARLVRQWFAESVVLAAGGTIAGLALAVWGAQAIATSGAVPIPSFREAGIDRIVLAFAVLISAGCALVFGTAPALLAARVSPKEGMSEGGKGSTAGRSRLRFQRALVATEVALAVILLSGAGLMRKGFLSFAGSDLGFRSDSILTMRVDLTAERYRSNDAMWALMRRSTDEIAAIPGVTNVALEGPGLPTGGWYQAHFRRDGATSDAEDIAARRHHVTPGYFETLGIRLLAGRDLSFEDVASAPRTLVVSKGFADRTWPGESAIGKQLRGVAAANQPPPPTYTVVGVVADVEHAGLDPDATEAADVYISVYQSPPRSPSLVTVFVRARVDAMTVLPAMRAMLEGIDPNLAFYDVQSMRARLDSQTSTGRFLVRLMTAFGVLGLLLAAVGVYGVIAYGVAQRTREIGVRVALGASRGDILRQVVATGMAPVGLGAVVGIAGVWGLERFVRSLLYGVKPSDPVILLGTLVLLGAAAFAASWLPARKAAAVEPLVALRD